MGSMSIDDSGNKRDMSAGNNFLYDRDGNMIEDKSKKMTISYDHRGLPVEFKREVLSNENAADSVRLVLNYDGAGSRISKIRERKSAGETSWTTELTTHYTGIGSEIREDALNNATKVVVNLPQGLGRYDIASASESSANTVPSFEWYLKNHLGSTMLVYGTQSTSDPTVANLGSLKAAYDYRAFGEQVDLTHATDKVTETFTGKEKDDETELSYFGARYLDQMLGMWVSVDAKRQFNSPYLYAGNGTNPVNGVDKDGNILIMDEHTANNYRSEEHTSELEVNAERWKRFNALNESPRIYQSKQRALANNELYIDPKAGALNGEYDNKTNIGYYDGTKEKWFHEMLGHAYQDEMEALLDQNNIGFEKGKSKDQYIGLEIDAREIEQGRLLTPAESKTVIDKYGELFDNE